MLIILLLADMMESQILKIARLGVLLNSKESPKNESVNDSILDLANYALLLAMIKQEDNHVN